jgi:hypothetical protein
MTWLPRSPGSTLVLRLNQETVHDFILLFMPPCGPHLTPLPTGSLERSLLVFSTPGGLIGDNLRACSSPTPTPVKPQPGPTILSQESVHTTLSITHHTRKRPSTSPRTTHGPQRGKAKPRSAAKSAKVTTLSSSRIRQTRKMRRCFRSSSSCGRGSAALDCPMSPSSMILRLVWRLVCLRRRGGCATWHASALPRS